MNRRPLVRKSRFGLGWAVLRFEPCTAVRCTYSVHHFPTWDAALAHATDSAAQH